MLNESDPLNSLNGVNFTDPGTSMPRRVASSALGSETSRQMRQRLCIQEHRYRQHKYQQKQQNIMLSGGTTVMDPTFSNQQMIPSFGGRNNQLTPSFRNQDLAITAPLSTVSEIANENPYFEEFLKSRNDDYDLEMSAMTTVDPITDGSVMTSSSAPSVSSSTFANGSPSPPATIAFNSLSPSNSNNVISLC